MTNAEIILGECALRGIYEKVGTYQFWAKQGRQVKKGQKALFETRIWKPRKKKPKENEEGADDNKDKKHGDFYLCRAFFFGESQLEELELKNA